MLSWVGSAKGKYGPSKFMLQYLVERLLVISLFVTKPIMQCFDNTVHSAFVEMDVLLACKCYLCLIISTYKLFYHVCQILSNNVVTQDGRWFRVCFGEFEKKLGFWDKLRFLDLMSRWINVHSLTNHSYERFWKK